MENEYECSVCHVYKPTENLTLINNKLVCEECYNKAYAEEQILDNLTDGDY